MVATGTEQSWSGETRDVRAAVAAAESLDMDTGQLRRHVRGPDGEDMEQGPDSAEHMQVTEDTTMQQPHFEWRPAAPVDMDGRGDCGPKVVNQDIGDGQQQQRNMREPGMLGGQGAGEGGEVRAGRKERRGQSPTKKKEARETHGTQHDRSRSPVQWGALGEGTEGGREVPKSGGESGAASARSRTVGTRAKPGERGRGVRGDPATANREGAMQQPQEAG